MSWLDGGRPVLAATLNGYEGPGDSGTADRSRCWIWGMHLCCLRWSPKQGALCSTTRVLNTPSGWLWRHRQRRVMIMELRSRGGSCICSLRPLALRLPPHIAPPALPQPAAVGSARGSGCAGGSDQTPRIGDAVRGVQDARGEMEHERSAQLGRPRALGSSGRQEGAHGAVVL